MTNEAGSKSERAISNTIERRGALKFLIAGALALPAIALTGCAAEPYDYRTDGIRRGSRGGNGDKDRGGD